MCVVTCLDPLSESFTPFGHELLRGGGGVVPKASVHNLFMQCSAPTAQKLKCLKTSFFPIFFTWDILTIVNGHNT